MSSHFDDTDFVDSDYQRAKSPYSSTPPQPALNLSGGSSRPPSREELDSKVGEAQLRLEELRRAQEELQRERAALEEARRRRVEFQTGREEMLQALTRGIGLIEEAEFNARRDAEQLLRTLADLRDHLGKVETLHEEGWTRENWGVELTRALTTLENARNEWNSARLKWPVLNASTTPNTAEGESESGAFPGSKSFGQLCRVGLALTWPVALVSLIGFALLLLSRR